MPSGLKLEFLPAYSPDFNPIELAFSLLKHKLRRAPPPSTSDFAARGIFILADVFDPGRRLSRVLPSIGISLIDHLR